MLLCTLFLPVAGALITWMYEALTFPGVPLWSGAMFLNSVFAAYIALCYPAVSGISKKSNSFWGFSPALLMAGGIAGSLVTSGEGLASGEWKWLQIFLFCGWIPVVEEVVFRGGLSPLLRWWLHPFWGTYFSVLLFTWLHSLPGLGRILAGEAGFLPGPLLLAVFCEILRIRSGSLWPAIAVHGACNASAFLFAQGNGGWFEAFKFLYMT